MGLKSIPVVVAIFFKWVSKFEAIILLGAFLMLSVLDSVGIAGIIAFALGSISTEFAPLPFNLAFSPRQLILGTLGAYSVKFAVAVLLNWHLTKFAASLRARIMMETFQSIWRLGALSTISLDASGIVYRVIQLASDVSMGFVTRLIRLAGDLLAGAIIVCVAIWFTGISAAATLLFGVGLVLLFGKITGAGISNISRRGMKAGLKINQILNAFHSGAIESFTYGKDKFWTEALRSSLKNVQSFVHKVSFLSALPKLVYEYLLVLTILVYAALQLSEAGGDAILKLTVFAVVGARLIPSFSAITAGFVEVRSAFESVKLLNNMTSQASQKLSTTPKYAQIVSENDKLNPEKRIVSFHAESLKLYKIRNSEEENIELISDLSLKVNAGSICGIFGRSGSGKTTFIYALLDHYQFVEGRAYCKDHTGRQHNLSSLKIGYSGVTTFFLEDTVGKNVAMSEEIDRLKVKRALDNACFPAKYGIDDMVHADGSNFSAGERQRLSLARAIYHGDHMLILDEPTSNLNQNLSESVLQNLRSLDVPVIIISHDVSLIDFFDEVKNIEQS